LLVKKRVFPNLSPRPSPPTRPPERWSRLIHTINNLKISTAACAGCPLLCGDCAWRPPSPSLRTAQKMRLLHRLALPSVNPAVRPLPLSFSFHSASLLCNLCLCPTLFR
jgi:hypothetical protein